MKNKSLFAVVIVMLCFFTISSPVQAEYNRFNCSDKHEVCQGVTVSRGAIYVSSDSIYIPSGKEVIFSFGTTESSAFNVNFWIENSNGDRVSVTKTAAQKGGNNWGFYYPPKKGNYTLGVECGDQISGRCKGTGHIYYYK